jgi:hypothetical protein
VFTERSVVAGNSTRAALVSKQILVETDDVSKTVSSMAKRLNADLLLLDHGLCDATHLSADAYEIIRASTCSVVRI